MTASQPSASSDTPLRVVINASPLLAPRTGIGNYIAELGRALSLRDELDLSALYGIRWEHAPPRTGDAHALHPVRSALRSKIKRWVPFKRELHQMQQRISFGRGLRRRHIDVYHEPNYVPIRYDVPVVVTIHDCSWVRFPQTHPLDRVRWLDRGLPRALELAAEIMVDSAFVRDEVQELFGVPAERMRIVHLGVSEAFSALPPAATSTTLAGFGLAHGSYLLSVATVEPRKNLSHLIQAFALLPSLLQTRFPLVIAGARGWLSDALERELHSLGAAGRLSFLGHVTDSDLRHLYAGAALFVFPSLYEGFGLPPLEAMACGAPVLASNRSSLPEVLGDAACLVDAIDPSDTANELTALLEDSALRAEYSRRGILRAATFTWTACAEGAAAAYRAAAGRS